MKCTRCHEHPATSVATGVCTGCLYEEEMGRERRLAQEKLARLELERERGRQAAAKRKVK